MDNAAKLDYRRRGNKKRLRLSARRKKRNKPAKRGTQPSRQALHVHQEQNNIVEEEWMSCQTDVNKLVQRKRPTKGSLFGPDESWPEEPPKEPASNTSATDVPIEEDNEEVETEDIQPFSPEEKQIIDWTDDDITEEVKEQEESEEVQEAEELKEIKEVVLDDIEAAPSDEWPIKKHLCRCCLVEGTFDSLHAPAPAGDVTYDEMLLQCFGIELFPVSSDVTTQLRGVCGLCAARLRDAHAFRHQVCMSDARFQDLYTRGCITVAGEIEVSIDLKSELPCLDDHFGSDMGETENSEELLVPVDKKPRKISKTEGDAEITQSGDEVASKPKKVRRAPKPRKGKIRIKPVHTPSNEFEWVDDQYKCTKCEKAFIQLDDLRNHFKKIHVQKTKEPVDAPSNEFERVDDKYKCTKCEEAFTQLGHLRKHFKKTHVPKKPSYKITYEFERIDDLYKCMNCEKAFKAHDSIYKHYLNKHSSRPKKVFKCSHCENGFPTLTQLKTHKLKEHNIDERFKCLACDKGFNRRPDLKSHVKSFHMMGELIKCSECDFECYSQIRLRRHIVKHKTTKDFHCKYCKKSFLRRSTLNFHERIHTGDKQKQCAECGQAFVQKASLNYHMSKYHPGVKF